MNKDKIVFLSLIITAALSIGGIVFFSPILSLVVLIYLVISFFLKSQLRPLFYLYFLAIFFIPVSIGFDTPFLILNVDRAILAVLIGAWTFALITKKISLQPVFIGKALLIYLVVIALSFLVNLDWIRSSGLFFRSLKTIFVISMERMLTVYIFSSIFKTREDLKKVIIFFVACLSLVAGYGIYESIHKENIFSRISTTNNAEVRGAAAMDQTRIGSHRAKSTQILPHVLGTELCMMFPVILCLLFKRENRLKPLFAVAAVLFLGAIAATYTRGVYLAFILAVILSFVLLQSNLKKITVIFAVMVLLCSAFFNDSVRNFTSEYFAKLFDPKTMTHDRERSIQARLEDYHYTTQHLKKKFWFGKGYGTHSPWDRGDAYLDNYYLYTLVETGILGFAAFLFLLYGLVFRLGYKIYSRIKTDKDAEMMSFLHAGFIVFYFQCLTYDAFLYIGASKLFWAMIAMVVVYLNAAREEENAIIDRSY